MLTVRARVQANFPCAETEHKNAPLYVQVRRAFPFPRVLARVDMAFCPKCPRVCIRMCRLWPGGCNWIPYC